MADGSAPPSSPAERVLDLLVVAVRAMLPSLGVEPAYLEGFLARHRPALLHALDRPELHAVVAPRAPARFAWPEDARDPARRAEHNLDAMTLLAKKRGGPFTAAERAILARYSGWGGISRLARYAERFPAGFPVPEARGLVHEYYTPTRVWQEVARVLGPELATLAGEGGRIRALEPSAGIGRALRAFEGLRVDWTAVEYSAVSSRLLRALFPAAKVVEGPFERFVADHPRDRFDLVVSNPPYGPRGAAAEEDPDTTYATGRASIYFLLRGLDLLRPGGIGVYLVPTGWLSGTSPEFRRHRERVLLRHHLLAAFRLPSVPPEGGSLDDVVYDQFVTDLLFFRSRGGTLPEVPAEDLGILDGRYLDAFPDHLLGTPVGEASEGWEPGQASARRGFQVVGRFTELPTVFVGTGGTSGRVLSGPWRPMVGEAAEDAPKKAVKARGGIARDVRTVEDLPYDLDAAVRLGMRVDDFLAQVARQDPAAGGAWAELHRDLLAWSKRHGDPHAHRGLRELASRRITGAERFLAAWTSAPGQSAALIPGLARPPKATARYTGDANLPAFADWLFRQRGGSLLVSALVDAWSSQAGRAADARATVATLRAAGWCVDGDGFDQLVPEDVYLSGWLWPKLDRALAHKAEDQARKLRERIGWRSAPEIIADCAPTDSWLPLELVAAWCVEALGARTGLVLERRDALLQPKGAVYADLDNTDKRRTDGYTRDLLAFLGWANLDHGLWNPERETLVDPDTGKDVREPVDEARRRVSAAWTKSWREWLAREPERSDRLETWYNRQLRGYVSPSFPADPLAIARWNSEVKLRDHQVRGARKLLANRSGLLAFDVGLGKTYCGLATLAMARQEGWAKRPVIVVPNSIVWKWYRDFARCLPDYKVLVIGSRRKVATRGGRKGRMVAEPDSPEERAAKWTRFQAGEADVVLLTYSALGRTRIDPEMVQAYVRQTVALRRAIALTLEAEEKADPKVKKAAPTERKAADMEERVRAWVGRMLTPPKGWDYDPGIDWHAIGVDLLLVDEAQNFKNLFHSVRDGEKADTRRAWALDFRCASVRAHSGGAGVVLLSATPAKNNPVEFYNMLHYLRPDVWEQVGIDNHEAFLGRFGDYQLRMVPDAGGQKLVSREVVARFKNLDELRDVLFRWGDFKVAEEVGLKLPDSPRRNHQVPPSVAQVEILRGLYRELADLEEQLRKVGGRKDDGAERAKRALLDKKRGLTLRIYLTYLHPQLPGLGTDPKAALKVDPHDAPKLVRCRDTILATSEKVCRDGVDCLECSHIVFCDNVAVHTWMRELLVEGGIPRERIAILNAIEAADTELRQQIVEGFNGVGDPGDEDYAPPRFDVVIANAVAYEGMDLQRRTCAIHHLDVPWEPATLQQRNGRGVRQGNLFGTVTLHYYFVEGSNEIHRIDRIERKRGWMSSLVSAQARSTNTTLEHELDEAGLEDLALAHAAPEDRERIRAARVAQEAERKAKAKAEAGEAANRELRQVMAQFRRADREADPTRAGELRAEAEVALQRLARFPAEVWPWFARATKVREADLFVPRRGPPLLVGEAITVDETLVEVGALGVESKVQVKTGRIFENRGVWLRRHGEARAKVLLPEDQDLVDGPNPVAVDVAWPPEKDGELEWAWRWSPWDWAEKGWTRLAPTTQARWWSKLGLGDKVTLRGFGLAGELAGRLRIPFEVRGGLGLLQVGQAETVPPGGELIAPTTAGWDRFVALGARSDLGWTELDRAAGFWWGRRFPKGKAPKESG